MKKIIIPSVNDVFNWARFLAFKDIYTPKNLRNKITIHCTPKKVIIKKIS